MRRRLVPVLILATLPHTISADTSAPSPEPSAAKPVCWEFTGAAGLVFTDGNSDSLAYNVRFLASRFTQANETWLSADYHYADDDGVKSTDTLRLGIQHDHKPGGPLYVGVMGGFLADPIADVDYRFDGGAHVGWHAYESGHTRLSFEVGPGYTWEKQGGVTEDFVNLRFAQRLSHRINSRTSLTQSLVFTPQADDFSNHLLVGEAALAVRISDKLALNTAIRHSIDNTPAAGRRKNDTTLIQSVSYILGGQPKSRGGGGSRHNLMPAVPAASVSPQGWMAEAALGFSLAQGNSDNLNLTITTDTAHRSDRGEFFFNTAYSYAENTNITSIDTLRVNARFHGFINNLWFAGGSVGYHRDPLADIEYRITPGAHFGRYFIKNDNTILSLETGPGYTFEKTGSQRERYASVQAAQRFEHALNPNVRTNQAIVYQADTSNFDIFTILATCSVDFRLNDRLSWRNAATWHFDNQPAFGKKRQDTTFTSGLAYRFW